MLSLVAMNTACMLSIHSPDDVCIHGLVSIFISKTHNHFWSAVRIANDKYPYVLNNVFILMRLQSDSQSSH